LGFISELNRFLLLASVDVKYNEREEVEMDVESNTHYTLYVRRSARLKSKRSEKSDGGFWDGYCREERMNSYK